MACYRVLMKHAEKLGERQYRLQLITHLKKGRKKSTFRYNPTAVHRKLVSLSSDVLGNRETPKDIMGYLAHDYDFNKERYG